MHLLNLNNDVLLEITHLLHTADRASLLQTSRTLHTLVTPYFPNTVVLSKSPQHTIDFCTFIFSKIEQRASRIRKLVIKRSGFVQVIGRYTEIHYAYRMTPLLVKLLAHARSLNTLEISSLHELEREDLSIYHSIALLPSLRTAAFDSTEWTGLLVRQMHLALSSVEVSPIRYLRLSTFKALGAINHLSTSLERLELRFAPHAHTDPRPEELPTFLTDSWPRVRQLVLDAKKSVSTSIDVERLSQVFPNIKHVTVEGFDPGARLVTASRVDDALWRNLRSVCGDFASVSLIPLSVEVRSLRLGPQLGVSSQRPQHPRSTREVLGDDSLLLDILSHASGTRSLHLDIGRFRFPISEVWSSIADLETLKFLHVKFMCVWHDDSSELLRDAIQALAEAPSLLYVSFSMVYKLPDPDPVVLTVEWELEHVAQPLSKLPSKVSYVENADTGVVWEITRLKAGEPAITRMPHGEAQRIRHALADHLP